MHFKSHQQTQIDKVAPVKFSLQLKKVLNDIETTRQGETIQQHQQKSEYEQRKGKKGRDNTKRKK